MFIPRLFSLALLCFSAVLTLAAPLPEAEQRAPGTTLSEAETAAFQHFNERVLEAFASLPKEDQGIISSTISSVVTAGQASVPAAHSKRVNVITPLEWLMEAIGADLLRAGLKDGQIVAHTPVAGEVAVAAAAGGGTMLSKYGGYIMAFAAGILATAIASTQGLSILGTTTPSTTTLAPAPATTTVYQVVKPTDRALD